MTREAAPDLKQWNLFSARALAASTLALSLGGCGTRPLGELDDTDGAESGESVGSSTIGTSVGTTGDACSSDTDCPGSYNYCWDGSCYYSPPCGDHAPLPDGTVDPKCSPPPYYECYDDLDCGTGYVCEIFQCVPGDDPEPLTPQCDDAAALPSVQIPVPELGQVVDLAFSDQTLVVSGAAAGQPDQARLLVLDLAGTDRDVVDLPAGFDPRHLALGDLDDDGNLDAAALDPAMGLLFVWDGGAGTIATFNAAGMTRVGAANLRANPGDELFGVMGGELVYWINGDPGALGTRLTVPDFTGVLDARDADTDGDGFAELLVTAGSAAYVYDVDAGSATALDETLVNGEGTRRLAGVADAGGGLPRILDAESRSDATYLRRHGPIPGGFAQLPSPWPTPFEGGTQDVALLRLSSTDRVDAVIAVRDQVYVWLDVLDDGDCWHLLTASGFGEVFGFDVGDADADAVEGLAYTDGSSVWIGGD